MTQKFRFAELYRRNREAVEKSLSSMWCGEARNESQAGYVAQLNQIIPEIFAPKDAMPLVQCMNNYETVYPEHEAEAEEMLGTLWKKTLPPGISYKPYEHQYQCWKTLLKEKTADGKQMSIVVTTGTGSGKTTVVRKIVEALPPHYVAVVPLDSYYNDTTGMTDEERHAINFDHPDAFDWKLLHKQVHELREGRAIEQPTYSYLKCNRLPETIHVEPKPVIIIEGIMTLLNKKLRDLMDLKIFVDCDPDERLIRNIQRDTIDRGRTVSMVVDRYLEVLKPMHEQFIEPTKRYADLIIPQGGENAKGIAILCKYIEGIIPKE